MNEQNGVSFYAILDGGGVKGAALAGCLAAAEEKGIEFIGYGGTSAGSVVALLAAVGYSGEDLRKIMVEMEFSKLLDDDTGLQLKEMKNLVESLKSGVLPSIVAAVRHQGILKTITSELGLYSGQKFEQFLIDKLREKNKVWEHEVDITFANLRNQGCKPLQIMVSDLRTRASRVYSVENSLNESVVDAVRASSSYPLVFRPVRNNNRYLVDGGLSCNLPLTLFHEERVKNHTPVIAFDLQTIPLRRDDSQYGIDKFAVDMLGTALDSSEKLLSKVLEGIFYVPIYINCDVDTLDFWLTREQRELLYLAGYEAATKFFERQLRQWADADTKEKQLQALHSPPALVKPLLESLAERFERMTNARDIRAHIMLPTGRGTLIVVYQYGMNGDTDIAMELGDGVGVSGQAWKKRKPMLGDLIVAKSNLFKSWGLSKEQQNLVRKDRSTIFCFPIFDRPTLRSSQVQDLVIRGILTVDTSTDLKSTSWDLTEDNVALEIGLQWADIFSKVIF